MTHPEPVTHTPSRLTTTFVLAVAVLLLAACSAGSDTRAGTRSEAGSVSSTAKAPSTTTAASDATTETTSTGTTDRQPGQSQEAPAKKVIATTTGDQPASPNDDTLVPLRLDVFSAKRLPGDAVEIRLSIANLSDTTALDVYGDFARLNSADYTLSAAALVDLPHDKRYLALLDSDDICLCTDLNNRPIEPGASMTMYVQFPAPAAGVDKVGFTLPGFNPINDLEIS